MKMLSLLDVSKLQSDRKYKRKQTFVRILVYKFRYRSKTAQTNRNIGLCIFRNHGKNQDSRQYSKHIIYSRMIFWKYSYTIPFFNIT